MGKLSLGGTNYKYQAQLVIYTDNSQYIMSIYTNYLIQWLKYPGFLVEDWIKNLLSVHTILRLSR
jgi:hypothetical protein